MHITGGAWSKVKEIMPDHSFARFDEWEIPAWCVEAYKRYKNIYDDGLFRKDLKPLPTMYTTLNMGIGMVLAVSREDADEVASKVGGFVGGSITVFSPADPLVQQEDRPQNRSRGGSGVPMKKHMQPRFGASDEALLSDLERLGEQMNNLTQDDLLKLCEEERVISGMDYKVSKIDAIQAELWRRSQVNKNG
jgi:hypothetical protein